MDSLTGLLHEGAGVHHHDAWRPKGIGRRLQPVGEERPQGAWLTNLLFSGARSDLNLRASPRVRPSDPARA